MAAFFILLLGRQKACANVKYVLLKTDRTYSILQDSYTTKW